MPGEYRALWSTPGGGAGFSVFHTEVFSLVSSAQLVADSIQDFFDTIKGIFPDEVTIAFDTEVKVLDDDGTLTAVLPVTAPTSVVGINSGTYNRAAGARVDWSTGAIVAGRRLTGRTYLVPCAAAVFDSNGLVTAGNITVLQTAGNTLIAALSSSSALAVWSRAHAVTETITGVQAPAQGAILRGRRD